MKLVKTASGKQQIKISKSEWEGIGKTAGWMKISSSLLEDIPSELESRFGGHSSFNGDDFKWEVQNEALGLAYIDVVYRSFDDILYVSKIYESEALDSQMGESFKIDNASDNLEQNKQITFSKLSKWLGR